MRKLALVITALVLLCGIANAKPKIYRSGQIAGTCRGIDKGHYEIHEGDHYVAQRNDTLANGATIQFIVNTPSLPARVHFLCIHRSSGEASTEVWRTPVVSALGTVVTPSNRDDSLGDNSGVVMHHTPTVINGGTLIPGYGDHFGAGQQRGGESRSVNEIMLAPDSFYLINTISEASSNDVTVTNDFYVDSGDAP